MIFPKDTRPTSASKEAIKNTLKEIFKKEPYRNDVGVKGIDIVSLSDNEPHSVYIRLIKLGSREPWCMSDGEISFDEYEITFLLDVRIPETDQQAADKDEPNISIKSYQGKPAKKLSDNGEITENVCDALAEIFSYRGKWRQLFSVAGIHNANLKDERETYQGTEYQNPMRLTFNAYVQT